MNQTVSFETINNKQVFQVVTEPTPVKKKIVIMSHGFRGTSVGPARTFVDFERLLVQHGFSCLRFDQPCSGNSEGDYIHSSFNEWIETTTYFATKYLQLGYQVALLGQSMGATTTMIVASQTALRDRIPCILLWVPDPKSTFNHRGDIINEEGGQQYNERFWLEAKQANFFACLQNYHGAIHLVFGDKDRYISDDLRQQVIDAVQKKNQPTLILHGQDHSPWDYDIAQEVYRQEIAFLQNTFS